MLCGVRTADRRLPIAENESLTLPRTHAFQYTDQKHSHLLPFQPVGVHQPPKESHTCSQTQRSRQPTGRTSSPTRCSCASGSPSHGPARSHPAQSSHAGLWDEMRSSGDPPKASSAGVTSASTAAPNSLLAPSRLRPPAPSPARNVSSVPTTRGTTRPQASAFSSPLSPASLRLQRPAPKPTTSSSATALSGSVSATPSPRFRIFPKPPPALPAPFSPDPTSSAPAAPESSRTSLTSLTLDTSTPECSATRSISRSKTTKSPWAPTVPKPPTSASGSPTPTALAAPPSSNTTTGRAARSPLDSPSARPRTMAHPSPFSPPSSLSTPTPASPALSSQSTPTLKSPTQTSSASRTPSLRRTRSSSNRSAPNSFRSISNPNFTSAPTAWPSPTANGSATSASPTEPHERSTPNRIPAVRRRTLVHLRRHRRLLRPFLLWLPRPPPHRRPRAHLRISRAVRRQPHTPRSRHLHPRRKPLLRIPGTPPRSAQRKIRRHRHPLRRQHAHHLRLRLPHHGPDLRPHRQRRSRMARRLIRLPAQRCPANDLFLRRRLAPPQHAFGSASLPHCRTLARLPLHGLHFRRLRSARRRAPADDRPLRSLWRASYGTVPPSLPHPARTPRYRSRSRARCRHASLWPLHRATPSGREAVPLPPSPGSDFQYLHPPRMVELPQPHRASQPARRRRQPDDPRIRPPRRRRLRHPPLAAHQRHRHHARRRPRQPVPHHALHRTRRAQGQRCALRLLRPQRSAHLHSLPHRNPAARPARHPHRSRRAGHRLVRSHDRWPGLHRSPPSPCRRRGHGPASTPRAVGLHPH